MSVLSHFVWWCLGFKSAETQTTPAERRCLARHASGKMRLAEIGVWHGVSTCELREAMDHRGTIFAIDPYPRGRLGFSTQRIIAQKQVSKVPNGTVQWIRKTGAEAAAFFAAKTESFDFVFLDGDHSYKGLQADWVGWKPLLAVGGIVALHDSHSSLERPIENAGSVVFTREVILRDPSFVVVDVVDSLTVLRRQSK